MTILKAKKREAGSKKTINEVFGNIYGKGKENIHVIFRYPEVEKVLKESGTSEVITIDVDGEKHDVVIKDVDIDPRKDRFYHIDFYEFTKGEVMETEVPLTFVGEAEAEKKGGVLNYALDKIDIEVLPKDLPKNIEVDLNQLKEVGDVIRVSDLDIPASVKVLNDMDTVVVSVVEAKAVEEEGDSEGPNLEAEQE